MEGHATAIVHVALHATYGEVCVCVWCRVAAANSKGFAVANFLLKHIVLIHPTVTADGMQSRSIGRWVESQVM